MSMKLIASSVSPNSTIVAFNSLPNDYDDLLLIYGLKSLSTSGDGYGSIFFQLNYSSGNHGVIGMTANGGSGSFSNAASYYIARSGSQTDWTVSQYPGNAGGTGNYTAQTLYIPNYRTSLKKVGYSLAGMTNHGSLSRLRYLGCSWDSTSAITSIRIQAWNDSLITGSYIYLYGIKNS